MKTRLLFSAFSLLFILNWCASTVTAQSLRQNIAFNTGWVFKKTNEGIAQKDWEKEMKLFYLQILIMI